jgi:D-threonate/D-erythronate kinase
MASITVVADDLTGALDTGVKFGGAGRSVVVHWRGAIPSCDVLVIDTDSRAFAPAVAAERIARWAPCVAGTPYKKVDSTLRGPFAAEAQALAGALGLDGVLLAPAAPAVGRVVRGGLLYVAGKPLAETAFRHDPTWPALTGEVAAIVAAQVAVPVALLDLGTVRAGPAAVQAALAASRGIVVADAESDADLLVLAQAVGRCPAWLAAGSAGLAQAMAAARGWQARPVTLPPGRRPQLLLCGSHNAASRAQVAALAVACGLEAAAADSGDLLGALRGQVRRGGPAIGAMPPAALSRDEARRALAALVDAAATLIVEERLETVFVTGGETLRLLAGALRLGSLRAIGELAPGVVLSRAVTPGGQELAIVSRAGGFGDDALLVRLMA